MKEEMISITVKDYDILISRSEWLNCLECAGVNNWEGIDMAYEMLEEEGGEIELR